MIHQVPEINSAPISSELYSRLIDDIYQAMWTQPKEIPKQGIWTSYGADVQGALKANFSSLNIDPEKIEEVALIGPGLNFLESVLIASCFPNAALKLIDANHAEQHHAALEAIVENFPEVAEMLERMSFQSSTAQDAVVSEGTTDIVYTAGALVDRRVITPKMLAGFLKTVRRAMKANGHFVCFGMDEGYEKAIPAAGFTHLGKGPIYVVNRRDPIYSFPFVNFQKSRSRLSSED